MKRTLVTAALGSAVYLLGQLPANAAEVETREPIKVLMVNSSDGDFIAAVFGEVLKEVGYRVRYVQADYAASFTAVATGDIDVSLAAWQTTGVELTENALATGAVENYGPTGVKATEGWWYSDATKEFCPELPDPSSLKAEACIEALQTPETEPLGRYLDAPADWGTQSEKTIQENGLSLALVNSGSPGALIASVQGALDRNEPILAWGVLPNPVFSVSPDNFVALPNLRSNVDVLKLGNKETLATAVLAARILRNLEISSDDVASAMATIDYEGVTAEEAAQDWMTAHSAEWVSWSQ